MIISILILVLKSDIMAEVERMASFLEEQTTTLTSYRGTNYYSYHIIIRNDIFAGKAKTTPEVKADLEEFAKNVLPHFDKYDIPWLNCKIFCH